MRTIRLLTTLALLITSGAAFAQTTSTVVTDSKSNSTVSTDADSRTFVISPPPSAITPSVSSSSSDLCTVGVAGAVQTQILGISSGETVRDPKKLILFLETVKINVDANTKAIKEMSTIMKTEVRSRPTYNEVI